MKKRNFGPVHLRAIKSDKKSLDSIRRNTRHELFTTHSNGKEKKNVVRYKPLVRKLGKNYIEMAQIEGFEPFVFNSSPDLKEYKVSPRLLRFANILRRTPFAGIRRIGYDIVEI